MGNSQSAKMMQNGICLNLTLTRNHNSHNVVMHAKTEFIPENIFVLFE